MSRGIVVVVMIVGVEVAIAVDVVGDGESTKPVPNEGKLQLLLPNGLGLKVLGHFGPTWLQLGGQNSLQTLPNPTHMASKSRSTSN